MIYPQQGLPKMLTFLSFFFPKNSFTKLFSRPPLIIPENFTQIGPTISEIINHNALDLPPLHTSHTKKPARSLLIKKSSYTSTIWLKFELCNTRGVPNFLWKFLSEWCRHVGALWPGRQVVSDITYLQGSTKKSTFLFFNFFKKFLREVILADTLDNPWKFHPDWSSHLRDH